jgi:hypothetical protein
MATTAGSLESAAPPVMAVLDRATTSGATGVLPTPHALAHPTKTTAAARLGITRISSYRRLTGRHAALDSRNMDWTTARRALVVVWVFLGIAGAMNHTIAEKLIGRRFNLVLPHLEYGYVMFNKNPHDPTVYDYEGADGVRRPLAELVHTPAIAYADARLCVNVILQPDYLREVCYRATRGTTERYTFLIDRYDTDVDSRRPVETLTLSCDAHGLSQR